MRALMLMLVLLCGDLGCSGMGEFSVGKPPVVQLPVLFVVHTDTGQPVAGARIETGGRDQGISDARGELRVELQGTAGERTPLSLTCPASYRPREVPEAVIIRAFQPLARAESALRIPLLCEPIERKVALVVRAETQAGLPVLARGQEVARTDANGIAHVLLSAQAGEELSVQLSTTGAPRLLPQNPRRQYRIGNADEILLMSEKFTLKPEPQRKVRVRREPVHERPYAL